jgi:hypothetical protein
MTLKTVPNFTQPLTGGNKTPASLSGMTMAIQHCRNHREIPEESTIGVGVDGRNGSTKRWEGSGYCEAMKAIQQCRPDTILMS